MQMSRNIPALILTGIILADALIAAKAEETNNRDVAAGSSIGAAQQFEALSPDAMIAVNGERMTKREFLTRKARERAEMVQKIIEMREESRQLVEAKRRAFLATQQAKLDEANAVARVAAQRLRAQETVARAPDYNARVLQGVELLKRAKTASPEELARIQAQAREILNSVDPDAAERPAH
jgi:hypothetical protein